jgi:uncharacterized alpha-E superfamily protein
MISRVADHCFWFGRYIERAESTARMIAQAASFALDAELPSSQVWRPIIVVSGEEDEFLERVADGSADHPAWGDGEQVQRFMVWDTHNGVSLASSISGARWNARSIREVLSLDAWEVTNELHLWFTDPATQTQYTNHREDVYRKVRHSTQLVLGLLRSTMLHDEPLDFMWLGVLLERLSQTARMLDVHHHAFTTIHSHELVETALWVSLLRALSGQEAFMKRATTRITSEAVARFLVAETAFPRSIAYCAHAAHERLAHIRPPDAHDLPGGQSLERLRVLDAWVTSRAKEPFVSVHDLLTHIVDEVHAICGTLGRELLGAGA